MKMSHTRSAAAANSREQLESSASAASVSKSSLASSPMSGVLVPSRTKQETELFCVSTVNQRKSKGTNFLAFHVAKQRSDKVLISKEDKLSFASIVLEYKFYLLEKEYHTLESTLTKLFKDNSLVRKTQETPW